MESAAWIAGRNDRKPAHWRLWQQEMVKKCCEDVMMIWQYRKEQTQRLRSSMRIAV